MSDLRLDLSTACLTPLPLPQVANLARQAGYDGLELVLGPDYLLHGPAWVRRMAAAAPLPIITVHQPLYSYGRWAQPAALVGDTVRLALDLGAEAVVLHSPCACSWESAEVQAWLAALDQAQNLTTGTATRLTVENLGEHRGKPALTVLSRMDELLSFCRQRSLGLTYDTCHAGTLDADLAGELTLASDVLTNVHLSDARPNSWLRHVPVIDVVHANHQMPGEGALALRAALAALVRQGYRGPVTFEVSPFAARSWHPRRRLQRPAQALRYARAALSSAGVPVADMAQVPLTIPAE